MIRKIEHPSIYNTIGNSMYSVTPTQINVEPPEDSEEHYKYKEARYLDVKHIDEYTEVEDDKDMLVGMSGTRIPRTNKNNTGGFFLGNTDPKGKLYKYGTDEETWLEELINATSNTSDEAL